MSVGTLLMCGMPLYAAEMEIESAAVLNDMTLSATATKIGEKIQYDTIEPEFVRTLSAFESGRNDSNPVWAPTGKMIAFERSRGDKREIVVLHTDGVLKQTIYFQLSGTEKDSKHTSFFLPRITDDPSYNNNVT